MQQQRIQQLCDLLDHRTRVSVQILQTVQHNKASAIQMAGHPSRLQEVEQIGKIINAINVHEDQLYQQRLEASTRSEETITGLMILLFVLGTLLWMDKLRQQHYAARLEKRLQTERTQFSTILQSVGSGILLADNDMRVEQWNQQAETITGYTFAELAGKNAVTMLEPRYVGRTFESVQQEVKQSGLCHAILTIKHKNGHAVYLNSLIAKRVDMQGNVLGTTRIFQDFTPYITEKEMLARELASLNTDLRYLQEQYRLVVDSMTDEVMTIDAGWNLRFANSVACRNASRNWEDMKGKNYFEVYPHMRHTTFDKANEVYANCIEQQVPASFFNRDTVTKRVYHIDCYPNEGGLTIITKDVTDTLQEKEERRALKEKLYHEREYYQLLIESLTAGFFSLDRNWILTYANKEVGKLVGKEASEMIGKSYGELWPALFDPENADYRQLLSQALDNGTANARTFNFGNQQYLVSCFPTGDGISVLYTDTTTHWENEKAIAQLNTALNIQVERYNTLVGAVTDGFYALDKEWRFTYANQFICNFFGQPEAALLGKRIQDLWPLLNTPAFHDFYNLLQDAIQLQKSGYLETKGVNNNTYGVWTYPSAQGCSVFFRDITDKVRKDALLYQLTTALELENQRYSELVNAINDGFYLLDRNLCFTLANEQTAQYLGRSINGLIGKPFPEIWSSFYLETSEPIRSLMQDAMEGKSGMRVFHNPDDNHIFDVWAYPSAKGIAILYRDKTEYYQAEAAKAQLQEEVSRLNTHLQEAREAERLNIARDLHDELGQELTGIKISLSLLMRGVVKEAPRFDEGGKDCIHLIDQAINTVRRLSTELRPAILDDLGLVQALEWQAQAFKQRSSIALSFQYSGSRQLVFAPGTAIHVFRIFQESLTNVMRHAKATEVQVLVHHGKGQLELVVQDNGRGIPADAGKKSLGLTGMRERAKIINANLWLGNGPQGGGRVTLQVACSTEKQIEA